jgi:hypothetical protein
MPRSRVAAWAGSVNSLDASDFLALAERYRQLSEAEAEGKNADAHETPAQSELDSLARARSRARKKRRFGVGAAHAPRGSGRCTQSQ